MTHDAHPGAAEPAAQALRAADGRWMLAGALTINSVAGVLASSVGMPLPETGRIDLGGVDRVDSSGVALLLEWKRRAGAEGVALAFDHVLPTMTSLAELYGVAALLSLA